MTAPNRRAFLKGLASSGVAAAAVSWNLTGVRSGHGAEPTAGADEIPVPLPRVARFERLAYGMFIHWGLYSQLGRGEWVMNREKIPKSEYQKLRDTFTAEKFDGRRLAGIARQAGMKYITLTARHHDGFSLYDTRGLSDHDVMHTPARRDLIADFTAGCRAEGIVPFLYHTTLDWWQDSFHQDFAAYLDYLQKSIEILCTQYGPIGGFWFDGNWSKKDADWQEDRMYAIIRRHQPEAIIVNNTGLHERGRLGHPEIDSVTFEQGRPTPMDRRGVPKYVAAEMCQTMNRHWGIGVNDFAYMAPPQIIEHLCACRKVGANYLLNVGPTAAGEIPDYESAALRRSGDWVRMHADAVYDGTPAGIEAPGDDFGLDAAGRLYLLVHHLGVRGDANVTVGPTGAGPRTFTGIRQKISKAEWVDNGEALKFEQDLPAGKLTVHCTGFPYGTNTVVRVVRLS
jgi:alpha-L-fucosidase